MGHEMSSLAVGVGGYFYRLSLRALVIGVPVTGVLVLEAMVTGVLVLGVKVPLLLVTAITP